MELTDLLTNLSAKMEQVCKHAQAQLTNIQAHKISRESLDMIKVQAYEVMTPLTQLARINVVDSQTLSIEPYDKAFTAAMEGAIRQHKKDHFVRQNKTGAIFITLPTLTQERRNKLVKEVQQLGEQGKIQIRNKRTEAKKELKNLQKEGVAEDEIKRAEERLQKVTDGYIQTIETSCKQKEQSLMTL